MADLTADQARGDAQDLRRRLKRLEDAVAFLRSSRSLVGRAVVDAGKELVIKGALKVIGNVSMVSADGNELFRLGTMPAFGRGLAMYRDDGTLAYRLAKAFSDTDQQQWTLLDHNEQIVVAENNIGPGLVRPYLAHPFQPIAAATGSALTCGPYGVERVCNSGTFTTLFVHEGRVLQPFLDLRIAAICSDGSTAGEVQVVDLITGTPLSGFLIPPWLGVIPAGTTTHLVLDPVLTDVLLPVFTNPVGDPMRIGIQVRRTAGAGTITVAVASSVGD